MKLKRDIFPATDLRHLTGMFSFSRGKFINYPGVFLSLSIRDTSFSHYAESNGRLAKNLLRFPSFIGSDQGWRFFFVVVRAL